MRRPIEHPDVVTYQFEIDTDEWENWKKTVPRTKPLDERLRELIRADAEGRVEPPEEDVDTGEGGSHE